MSDLAKTQSSLMANRPDFIKRSSEGTEHLKSDDLRLPRLTIAQNSSKQLDEDEAVYIEGLEEYNIFNDVTEEIYEQPLKFAIVCAYPPRWIEFRPREEGGGILDMNVPEGDPRTEFGPNGEVPKATKFYDYVLFLYEKQEIIALSLKSTGIKAARQLNTLIRLRNAPVYSGLYVVEVKKTSNKKGKFGIFTVDNAGWIEDESLHSAMAQAHVEYKDKVLEVKEEQVNEDPDPPEAGNQGASSDDIPF